MNDITKIKVDGEPESSYQLYPRNEEFAKRAGGNGGSQSGVQPDWNQNDATKPDYVKNRPFYTGELVETVLVEESTVSFGEKEGLYTAQVLSTFEATVGETYKVSWDGTIYECSCVDFGGFPFIGNLYLIGVGSDTGEPFSMMVTNGVGMDVGTTDTSESHTFSVSGFVAEVVKIDEKYLPEIPSDKFPKIPVIEFTTSIIDSIGNATQPYFDVSNLSYSEIHSIVEKVNFQIKDSSGSYYSPIKCSISSYGTIYVDILIMGSTASYYAELSCAAAQTRFYRNNWWQIEATKK